MAVVADVLSGPIPESCERAQLRRAVIASTVDHHRMVRLSPLQRRHRPGVRQAVLPPIAPAGRRTPSLCDLFCGVHCAPDRRGDFRALRRPHRPQGGADRDPADYRRGHFRRGASFPPMRRSASGARSFSPSCASFRGSASAASGAARSCCRWSGRAPMPIAASSPLGRNWADRPGCCSPIWRCWRSAAISGDQFLVWGWRVPFLLSIVMVGIGLYIRLGILEMPAFPAAGGRETDRTRAGPGGDQAAAQGDHPLGPGADGRAGAGLHLLWLSSSPMGSRCCMRRGTSS